MSKSSNFVPSLKYIRTTLKHKWFVFRAGRRVKVPLWQLLIHDWSKFTLSECPHYGRQFFGTRDDPDGFDRAWLHHQNLNPHHWEYWIPRTTHFGSDAKLGGPLLMPDKYLREMVADWYGANRTYEGEWVSKFSDWEWFTKSFKGLALHPSTREEILRVFRDDLGIH